MIKINEFGKDKVVSDKVYESRDKQVVPFLFTQPDISFIGTIIESSVIYFQFTPFNRCEDLVNQFSSRKAPLVQPKDLLDAVETYRDRVFEMKDKRYETKQYQ